MYIDKNNEYDWIINPILKRSFQSYSIEVSENKFILGKKQKQNTLLRFVCDINYIINKLLIDNFHIYDFVMTINKNLIEKYEFMI
jgi:hypothetical protein